MTDQQIITWLWDKGHFCNPAHPNCNNVQAADLSKLSLADRVVQEAVASLQAFDANLPTLVAEHHGRAYAIPDGDVGPATRELMAMPRCGHPDFVFGPQPAVGTGNWKRCHGIGEFHAAIVKVQASTMPAFLAPIFDQVWAGVVRSYMALGLKFVRDDNATSPNIDFSFVQPDGGWIGLAIVGQGQSCTSRIWCRYDRNYQPANLANEWLTLIKHELGHNCGLSHSSGGVMNPSIVRGLPELWTGDPSERLLKTSYGGQPIVEGPEVWTHQGLKSNRGDELWLPLNPPIPRGA